MRSPIACMMRCVQYGVPFVPKICQQCAPPISTARVTGHSCVCSTVNQTSAVTKLTTRLYMLIVRLTKHLPVNSTLSCTSAVFAQHA